MTGDGKSLVLAPFSPRSLEPKRWKETVFLPVILRPSVVAVFLVFFVASGALFRRAGAE
jgi:hypothetical protein